MKTRMTSCDFENQIIEYLLAVAAHYGFCWDGLEIEPGTTVASFKTIAAETGLSYYRVRKCIVSLVGAGVLTIFRHKGLAVITVNASAVSAQAGSREESAGSGVPACESGAAATSACTDSCDVLPPAPGRQYAPVTCLNRAARRRMAREAARKARHAARSRPLPRD